MNKFEKMFHLINTFTNISISDGSLLAECIKIALFNNKVISDD